MQGNTQLLSRKIDEQSATTRDNSDAQSRPKNYKGINDQFTFEEYLRELDDYHLNGPQKVSQTDHTDQAYFTKFAHCLPPLAAYKLVPPLKDRGGNTQELQNNRKVYSGWENLTNFEEKKILEVKTHIRDVLKFDLPSHVSDLDILMFAQSFAFNTQKTATELQKHCGWKEKWVNTEEL